MKKWNVVVTKKGQKLECIVNARTADEAVNLAFMYFRAFDVTGEVHRMR